MANTNITSNNFFDPRRYRNVYDEEKKAWVKKHLKPSPSKVNIVQRKDKKTFAAPNHILIDDHIKNIRDFESAGGVGIVHTSAIKTIKQLKSLVSG